MENFISIFNKLFNSLGRKTILDQFGVDFNFKVHDVRRSSFTITNDQFNVVFVEIVGNDKVVFRNKNVDEWSEDRYFSLYQIEDILSRVSLYVGGTQIKFVDENGYLIDLRESWKDCDEIIELKSVGTFFCKLGLTFSDEDSLDDFYLLSDIENADWWDGLSDEDKNIIDRYIG